MLAGCELVQVAVSGNPHVIQIDNVSKVWANDEAIPPRTMVHVMVSKGILHGFQSVPTTWILTSLFSSGMRWHSK